ncbi:MAG: hypothetical protein IKP76_03865 [Bacilli bacterium]|nr:hypothetical protein [Bacilli bacterium]
MGYITSFVFPLIYIILFTYSLTVIFKNKFEYNIVLTFVISALMLYVSLFVFHTIYVGLVINILFCFIFPIYLIKNKYTFKDIKNKYLTNTLIGFIAVYIFIYLYDLNRFYTRWDELSHWGKMVKEIIRLDDFYSISQSHLLVHKDYPPIFSLMETFFTLISGGFKETYLIRCIHLFEGSIVISTLNYFKEKKTINIIIKTLLSLAIIYIITLLFDSEVFVNSIYIDYPLAAIVAYMLFIVFRSDKISYNLIIKLGLFLTFILLAKQVSIAFFLMIIFMLLIKMILNRKKLDIKKILITIFVVLIVPITMLTSWNKYKDNLNTVAQFKTSDIKITEVKEIMTNAGENNWQHEASTNYLNALFNKNISSSYLKITFIGTAIVMLLLVFIVYNNTKDNIKKSNIYILLSTIIIGYIGYTLLMYLMYVFNFGPIEGPAIASFDRYMSTYVLICLYVLLFILFYYKNIKHRYLLILLAAIMITIRPHQYLRLRPDLIILPNHHYDESIYAANKIDRYVNQDDKVFIIDQVEKNGSVFYINYFSTKATTNLTNYEMINIDDNIEVLQEYDYLYTYSLNTSELELHQLYKIYIEKNKVKLIKVDYYE